MWSAVSVRTRARPRLGRCLRAVLAVCLPLALVAEEAPAQRDVRVKTVVVGLSARRGVDEGLALAISDVVQGVLSGDSTRLVLGREDIRRVLSFEEERAALGCDTASCLSEIASALDVDRMVTGSIDKVGSTYFVVITEIDARTVEPLARVQRRLPLDEDELVTGVQQMTAELLQESGRAPVRADGTVGSVLVSAEPKGARVFIAGEEKGVTPLRLDGLPPGTHKVTIAAVGFAPVEMEVPVYKDQVTEVGGRLGDRPQPSAEEVQEYADESFWNTVFGWSKVGGSAACCAGGVPCFGYAGSAVAYAVAPNFTTVASVACGATAAACALGICTWGVLDLLNPPEDPVSTAEATHRLTIAPPPGTGEVQTLELDAVGDDEMAH